MNEPAGAPAGAAADAGELMRLAFLRRVTTPQGLREVPVALAAKARD